MLGSLKDPSLPPGALVEEYCDGGALRNDGLELRPAGENPWYVLATVYGEQTRKTIDMELHERNRRIWNGWVGEGMTVGSRSELANRCGLVFDSFNSLTPEETRAVDEAFRERLRGQVRPSPESVIDFSSVRFKNSFCADGFVFPAGVDFRCSRIEKTLGFSSANFLDRAAFNDVVFADHASFVSASFHEVAIFDAAVFLSQADFKSAYFSGDAGFRQAKFERLGLFSRVKFMQDADFSQTNFRKTALFGDVDFHQEAVFSGVCVGANALFKGANFFAAAIFDGGKFCSVADFSNAVFKARIDFSLSEFLGSPPTFYECSLHQDSAFTCLPENWPKVATETASASKRAYARLRQIMTSQERVDEALFFHRQEMRCKALSEPRSKRWLISLYGLLSDYGHSVLRPLGGLAVVVGVGWGPIGSWLQSQRPSESADCIWEGLGLSLTNSLPFLNLSHLIASTTQETFPAWIKVLAGVQAFFGIVFLFLSGLALRNLFRLK